MKNVKNITKVFVAIILITKCYISDCQATTNTSEYAEWRNLEKGHLQNLYLRWIGYSYPGLEKQAEEVIKWFRNNGPVYELNKKYQEHSDIEYKYLPTDVQKIITLQEYEKIQSVDMEICKLWKKLSMPTSIDMIRLPNNTFLVLKTLPDSAFKQMLSEKLKQKVK